MTNYESKDKNGIPNIFGKIENVPKLNFTEFYPEDRAKIGKTFKNLKVIQDVGISVDDKITWFETKCIKCDEMQIVSNVFLNITTSDSYKDDCNCIWCYRAKVLGSSKADYQDELVGKKFNNFTVIRRVASTEDGVAQYECKCSDCGEVTILSKSALDLHVDYNRNKCELCPDKSSAPVENTSRRLKYEEYTPALNMDKKTFDLMFKRIKITNWRIRRLDSWLTEEKTNFKLVGFRSIEKDDKVCKILYECKHCGMLDSVTKYRWDKMLPGAICECQKASWQEKTKEPPVKTSTEVQEELIGSVGGLDNPDVTNKTFKRDDIPTSSDIKTIKSEVSKEYKKAHSTETKEVPKKKHEEVKKTPKEEAKDTKDTKDNDGTPPKFDVEIAFNQLIEALKQIGVYKETVLSYVHVNEDLKNNDPMGFNVETVFEKSGHIATKFKNLIRNRSNFFTINVNYYTDFLNERLVLCINSYDKNCNFVDKVEIKIMPNLNDFK